eukprot:scaffold1137_cov392-Pavlova_lutheri.AAC.9
MAHIPTSEMLLGDDGCFVFQRKDGWKGSIRSLLGTSTLGLAPRLEEGLDQATSRVNTNSPSGVSGYFGFLLDHSLSNGSGGNAPAVRTKGDHIASLPTESGHSFDSSLCSLSVGRTVQGPNRCGAASEETLDDCCGGWPKKRQGIKYPRGDLRSNSGAGTGDGIENHTEKWLSGGKSPMQWVAKTAPVSTEDRCVGSNKAYAT